MLSYARFAVVIVAGLTSLVQRIAPPNQTDGMALHRTEIYEKPRTMLRQSHLPPPLSRSTSPPLCWAAVTKSAGRAASRRSKVRLFVILKAKEKNMPTPETINKQQSSSGEGGGEESKRNRGGALLLPERYNLPHQ